MVGEIIKNQNGKDYVVIAQVGEDKALLHGGHDYVVINNLSYFRVTRSWCGGTYFPCFNDSKDSYSVLSNALTYFKSICFVEEDLEEEYND